MFAGIGGICLGFKQAGAEIIWANEIDPYACTTYRTNLGSNYLEEEDIKKVDIKKIPKFDILVAGFPCQPFSIAGQMKGFEDERGELFFEIVKMLREKKPKAFLLENVKNLEKHDKEKTFKVIKEKLEACGYHIKSKVINSCEVGNVPQNRERIYIVGFTNKKNKNMFEFPEQTPLTNTLFQILKTEEKEQEEFYYREGKYTQMIRQKYQEEKNPARCIYQVRRFYVRATKTEICPTLTATMGMGGHNVPIIQDNYGLRKLTPKECLLLQGFPKEYKIPEGMANCHIYKQAGNAVTVPVIRRIAEAIMEILEKGRKKNERNNSKTRC